MPRSVGSSALGAVLAAILFSWSMSGTSAGPVDLAPACPPSHQDGSLSQPTGNEVRVVDARNHLVQMRCIYRGERPRGWNTPPGPQRLFQVIVEYVEPPGFVTGCDAQEERNAESGRIVSGTHAMKVEYFADFASTLDMTQLHEFARRLMKSVEPWAIPCPGLGTTPVAAGPSGKPLCVEARDPRTGFTPEQIKASGIDDPMDSHIQVDDEQLRGQIVEAIQRYNRERPDLRAHVTAALMPYGVVGTGLWLSTEGGIRADPDNTTAKLNEAFYRQYGTGLERSLRDGIVRYARQAGTPSTPYRLTVGEVLYLALDLTGGDMRKASLTVHNTLRSLARGKSNGDADQPITGVEGDPTFENKYLQALRLPKKAGTTRENGGPWYHLFGTMHLEIEARGDWGAWVSNAAGHFTGSKLLSLVGKIGSVFLGLESGRGVSVLSETGNEMEQAVRLGRVDPEKYCFNLWGATIGAWIYRELPGVAMRRFTEPFSSFERPQLDRPTFGAPPETGRYFSGSGSPFSIQWTGPGYAALFDQGRGEGQINMYGGAPFLIQPYPTADGSWGAIWSSGDGEQPVVTFEANQPNAELHVFHADRTGGTVAFYRARAEREGERLTLMPAPAGGPPELRNESGVVFPPTLHELPGTGGLFGDSRTGIVLIVLGLVVTLAGVVWLRNFPRAA